MTIIWWMLYLIALLLISGVGVASWASAGELDAALDALPNARRVAVLDRLVLSVMLPTLLIVLWLVRKDWRDFQSGLVKLFRIIVWGRS